MRMDDIGEHMQPKARSIQREKCVDKVLVSSMKGEGIVTPLIQKYIEMVLMCMNIEWIREYLRSGFKTKSLMIEEWLI